MSGSASRHRARGGRLAGVEGLRACAAIAVTVQHCWLFDGGDRLAADGHLPVLMWNLALGVTLFFALSGFLLYRPFAAAMIRGEPISSVKDYLRNRALRILPAYWAILLFAAFVSQSATWREGDSIVVGAPPDPVQLVKSMFLVQNYDPGSLGVGLGPAWSLAVEVVFYLTLPLLVVLAARQARVVSRRGRRVLIALGPAALLLVVGLTGKLAAAVLWPGDPAEGWGSDWHSVIERSFWAQADLFVFGMAAAVAHTEYVDGRLRLPRWWRAAAIGLAVAIVIPCALTLGAASQLSYLPQNTAVALAAGLFLAAVVFPGPPGSRPQIQRGLEWRPIVAVGLLSYSVFLWNEPVLRWLTPHGVMRDGWVGLAWNLAVTAVAVGAMSWLSYRFVELPWLRRKAPRAQTSPALAGQWEAAP